MYINNDASIILLEINYNQQSCWNVSTYLAANDGPYFIIWGSWSARDVWVAVAKATRAVEVEACRSNCRTGHCGIMHWTAQSSWAYYAEQNKSKLKHIRLTTNLTNHQPSKSHRLRDINQRIKLKPDLERGSWGPCWAGGRHSGYMRREGCFAHAYLD